MYGNNERYVSARDAKAIKNFPVSQFQALQQIGIDIPDRLIDEMTNSRTIRKMIGMDAIVNPMFPSSTLAPSQFLQSWLPGFVYNITLPTKIDELVDTKFVGDWSSEEAIQGTMELLGTPLPYGDYTNIPLASWNIGWQRRTMVRFEEGMMVGILEEERSAKLGIDSAAVKRQAAARALDLIRNNVGFNGFNSGQDRTYGFFNDPSLGAYVNVPNGAAGSPLWANKTFLEISKDIRSAIVALRTQSGDTVDPRTTRMTLAVASAAVDWMSTTGGEGYASVFDWLERSYPGIRIVSAPQLNAANGGANVFYLYADEVNDGYSTDGGRAVVQLIGAKFRLLGVEQLAKAYKEDYSNAVSGILFTRPYLVVRRSGI